MRWNMSFVLALALVYLTAPVVSLANKAIGHIESLEGTVMCCPADGHQFAPARQGQPLFAGGVIVTMETGRAVLQVEGKGRLTIADNAALKLAAIDTGGEYSAVTGVRAPVLFLYPTGQSNEIRPGTTEITFGLNHDLDSVRGLTDFRVYALHEDNADELDDPDGPESIRHGTVIASFSTSAHKATEGYTWYSVKTSPLEVAGEYIVFIAARREATFIRLGQSTLLVVSPPDETGTAAPITPARRSQPTGDGTK